VKQERSCGWDPFLHRASC